DGGARQNAADAASALALIPDAELRKRARGDVLFAEGAAALRADPARAAALLGDAIDAYRAANATPFLTECHLLRARARSRLGDAAGAQRDLDDGIAVYERHPVQFAEGVVGTGVFNAGSALYHDAVGAALARGDTAAAFAYAERSLAQIGAPEPIVTPADLQQRLRGSGAVVLELVVLPHDVVVFTVAATGAGVHRQAIEESHLGALADAAANGDSRASSSLYALLIAPAQADLARAKEAIIVAGRPLARVPFAALADPASKRMLIEQLPLSVAPSASVLRPRAPHAAPRSIVAVSIASDDVNLPGSAEELADVRRFYAQPVDIDGEHATAAFFFDVARNADVIHLSGHSAGNAAAGEAELFFGPAGRRERTSWRRLSSAALAREPVVVLAACETLVAPGAAARRTLSLGEAFLAAGAGEVVGTLSPVADDEARLFFHDFHRALAAGAGPAAAVREAQLEAIRGRRGTAWRSVAVLTRHIPQM
ncbi:MAG TPA: CHAT domain-containing protein, partial [Thermoanaerobaculia bacterium]|nr:CHAT domain-containing protein [Thermoanaerobaculia bacterium]